MSNVRFIGCLHIGHPFMARHRGFVDGEEANIQAHWYAIRDGWNSVVNKKDLTFILGDVTMENPLYYPKLDELQGRKIVVMGNHDLYQHARILLKHVESVAGMVDYKGCALTHAPIHPSEVARYRLNIHAHIHENVLMEVEAPTRYRDNVPDNVMAKTLHKYRCVDAKRINFIPKTLAELLEPL